MTSFWAVEVTDPHPTLGGKTIDTENAAFDGARDTEVARILRSVANRLDAGEDFSHYLTLFDANGNDVGRAAFKEEETR